MLGRISSRELSEWIAFDQLEPIGEPRDDYRAGLICSVLATVHSGRSGRQYRPIDFMSFAEKPQAPTPEQAFGQLLALAKRGDRARRKRGKAGD